MGRHDKGGGSLECPTRGTYKESVEHVLFECVSYDSQIQDYFLDYLKTVLPPDAFEAFLHDSIFDESPFCLGERKVCWKAIKVALGTIK